MGERPPFPTDRDVAEAREEQLELRIDTAFPGRVQSYDPDLQVADVVPLVRKQVPQPDGSYALEELPVLPCVPVIFPRMGPWFLALPIAPGDTGLVVVCSGAIGHWRVGDGGVTDPGDLRRHHLAHAVFLPLGLVPRSQKLTQTGAAGATDGRPTGVVLGSDAASGPRILVRANGAVEIATGGGVKVRVEANGDVHVGGTAGSLVALGDLVDARIEAIREWLNTHTHPVAGATASAPTVPLPGQDSVAASKVWAT